MVSLWYIWWYCVVLENYHSISYMVSLPWDGDLLWLVSFEYVSLFFSNLRIIFLVCLLCILSLTLNHVDSSHFFSFSMFLSMVTLFNRALLISKSLVWFNIIDSLSWMISLLFSSSNVFLRVECQGSLFRYYYHPWRGLDYSMIRRVSVRVRFRNELL